ncbi:zliS Lysozyme family protein [uncultured Caudovirales phage]|uniref:ZliS Lysozyme family protein n=1 Tax=uncultured Caudovirales phage TaxID=2100421 RepID=A0A6J5S484_9CAUD|nr:zliS Lysozyme family protein [uncultured Caudovirales phage]
MKDNFDTCFDLLMITEGGYSNHKDDPGGKTKYGITEKTWIDYNKKLLSGSELHISRISKDMAKKVYKKDYWLKSSCDSLPLGIDYCVFDAAVNSGVAQASKWLQRCLRVHDDGIIGKDTLKAVQYCLPSDMIREFCTMRFTFLKTLKAYETFGNGWKNRINSVEKDSLSMAKWKISTQNI